MANITAITKSNLKKDLPDIRPGDTVRIQQIIKDKEKEKIQIFEGLVLARKHGKGINATITVRKVMSGVGVEKVFPIHTPMIKGIEIVKRGKVRRAKLYYLREAKGRKARLKRKEIKETKTEEVEEKPKEEPVEKAEEVKVEEVKTVETKQPKEKVEAKKTTEKSEEKKEEKKEEK